jgi:hypothetical protein
MKSAYSLALASLANLEESTRLLLDLGSIEA